MSAKRRDYSAISADCSHACRLAGSFAVGPSADWGIVLSAGGERVEDIASCAGISIVLLPKIQPKRKLIVPTSTRSLESQSDRIWLNATRLSRSFGYHFGTTQIRRLPVWQVAGVAGSDCSSDAYVKTITSAIVPVPYGEHGNLLV